MSRKPRKSRALPPEEKARRKTERQKKELARREAERQEIDRQNKTRQRVEQEAERLAERRRVARLRVDYQELQRDDDIRARHYDDKPREHHATEINEFLNTAEERDWLRAIDEYKRAHNDTMPDWPTVLRIAKRLGYRKGDTMSDCNCTGKCCQQGTDSVTIGIDLSGGPFNGGNMVLSPGAGGCAWSNQSLMSGDGQHLLVVSGACEQTSPGPPPIYQMEFTFASSTLVNGVWVPDNPPWKKFDVQGTYPIDCSKIALDGTMAIGQAVMTIALKVQES